MRSAMTKDPYLAETFCFSAGTWQVKAIQVPCKVELESPGTGTSAVALSWVNLELAAPGIGTKGS
jgi:hypothetical protein